MAVELIYHLAPVLCWQLFPTTTERFGQSFSVSRSLNDFKELYAAVGPPRGRQPAGVVRLKRCCAQLEQRFPKAKLPPFPATRNAALAWASGPSVDDYCKIRSGLQQMVDAILGHVSRRSAKSKIVRRCCR